MKNFYARCIMLCAFGLLLAPEIKAQEKNKSITDPVCGLKVNLSESYDWKYSNKTYHFHSYDCMYAFKMNPQHFLLVDCIADMISIDPVCAMKVNKAESYDLKYKGKTYYFDSYECRETFLLNPEKFLKTKCDTILNK